MRASRTFLATGFEPFRHHRVNSSWAALSELRDGGTPGVAVVCLPVEHREAHDRLRLELARRRPWAVLCTGLAEGEHFRIETRARRPPELAGEPGERVLEGRWPWSEMERSLRESGVPVRRSDDAGRYVCESTYWSLLSYRQTRGWPLFAAFLHVPPLSAEYSAGRIADAIGRVVDARLREPWPARRP